MNAEAPRGADMLLVNEATTRTAGPPDSAEVERLTQAYGHDLFARLDRRGQRDCVTVDDDLGEAPVRRQDDGVVDGR